MKIKANTDSINVYGKKLNELLTTSPDTHKMIQDLISVEVKNARDRLAEDIKKELKTSEHESWRSVRRVIYNKVLGANLNILKGKKGTGSLSWKVRQRTRKLDQDPKQRGGNRRKRSPRTIQVDGYDGKMRGFVLRWVNDGTKQRFIGGRNTMSRYYDLVRTGIGNRGQISPTEVFFRNATKELGVASEKISAMIDAEMEKVFNKKQ